MYLFKQNCVSYVNRYWSCHYCDWILTIYLYFRAKYLFWFVTISDL